MLYNPPIPSVGIAALTHKPAPGRVFYQMPGGTIRQSVHKDGKWIHEDLPFKAVPLSPLAVLEWDDGKEIRVFYLDNNYVIQGYCYTQGKQWYQGKIGKLGVKVSPTSRLGAVGHFGCFGGGIHVYFQEANSQVIRELIHDDGHWHIGKLQLSGALDGTSIASVKYLFEGEEQIRLYYQNAEGKLKEQCHNAKRGWFPGEFERPGAPLRTPISAIAFGVHVQLQVYWRDAHGHVVFRKHTGRWNETQAAEGVPVGFRFTVSEVDSGKSVKIFTQDYLCTIYEFCSEDGGKSWHKREKITD